MVSSLLAIWDVSPNHIPLWEDSFADTRNNMLIPRGGIHVIPPLASEYMLDRAQTELDHTGNSHLLDQ